jgi:NNP family nitrate/nitrite transporter-like MFS transporter
MFTKEVVGTANALCGGWGNLGGGVTQLVMGSALFPLFKVIYNDDVEKAWRTVTVVPAVVAMATGIIMYLISDDAPKGNYTELKKHGAMPEVSAAASFRQGAWNMNTWVLFLQYAGKWLLYRSKHFRNKLFFGKTANLKNMSCLRVFRFQDALVSSSP